MFSGEFPPPSEWGDKEETVLAEEWEEDIGCALVSLFP